MKSEAESPMAIAAPPLPADSGAAIDADQVVPEATCRRRWAGPLLILALLAATHYLVDFVAGTVNPLWPMLERHVPGVAGNVLWVYIPWMVTTSFSQLLFGMWADRLALRWLIWGGPAVAVICLSCIGYAPNFVVLATLYALGGLGVAAFHPEAAALAGSLVPTQRSRAMAVFALSGYLGQSCGPFYSGSMTEELGLRGLIWGLAWGGGPLLLLAIALSVARQQPAEPARPTAAQKTRIRPGLLAILLAIGSLRITPALGVPFTLAFLLDASGAAGSTIGFIQSVFMAGIGMGAMGCAAFGRREYERGAIWLLPLCAAPLLIAMTWAQGWILAVLVWSAGLLLGFTMPIYISYGQQLIPQSQRVASSITMGVSWGLAGGFMMGTFEVFRSLDVLAWMFPLYAVMCITSSVLCRWLPVPEQTQSGG